MALRQELVATAGHARTADIGAQLATAWRFITGFAVECRAITEVEAAAYLRRADAALALIASEQTDIQSACDPIERFRALLNGAVASGRAHIAGVTGGEPASPSIMGWRKIGMDWQPQGRCIGWEDGAGGLYLEPEASFAAVQEMGTPSGESIGIGSATLRKRLHERGLLLSVEDENGKMHLAVRRTIGGRRRRVLHIANLLVIPDIGGPSGPDGPRRDKHEQNQGAFAKNGAKNGGPVEIASGPSGPEVGVRGDSQNGVAHPKWARGEKWATDAE